MIEMSKIKIQSLIKVGYFPVTSDIFGPWLRHRISAVLILLNELEIGFDFCSFIKYFYKFITVSACQVH